MSTVRVITCLCLLSLFGCDDKEPASRDQAPKDQAPKDQAPKDPAPKDQAPKDQAPKDQAPKDSPKRPAEATPVPETAEAPVVKASFDSAHAFRNTSGELSLSAGSLTLTLRAELDAPIKLSAPYPKAEKHARFEYSTADGEVTIGGQAFDAKLESSSMTPSRESFIIPIDAPGLDRSATANVPDIVFWALEVPAKKAKGMKSMCGKEVEVSGSGSITSPRVSAFSDLIVYDGDKKLPVKIETKLLLTCS